MMTMTRFLCCFLQIITTDEAERRGHIYDRQGSTYLFDLDYVEDVYTVDAAHQGNISHFVNHSVSVFRRKFKVFRLCRVSQLSSCLHIRSLS